MGAVSPRAITVASVLDAKLEAQAQINQIIHEFERDTGCRITGFDLLSSNTLPLKVILKVGIE